MRAFTVILLAISSVTVSGNAYADSPLTSIDFHEAYTHKMIVGARRAKLSVTRTAWLLNPHVQNALKAAVINAMGWSTRGLSRAPTLLTALARKYKTTPAALSVDVPSASELFVLGYMVAMDDYFRLKPITKGGAGLSGMDGLALLDRARKKAPTDFTIALIHSLAAAQLIMKSSFCKVFTTVDAVLKAFPHTRRNMKPEAVLRVRAYIRLYKKSCPQYRRRKTAYSKYNRVSQLIPWMRYMVAVSRDGLVLWDTVTLKPAKHFRRKYLRSVIATGRELFVLTTKSITRWDGTRWRTATVRNLPHKRSYRCGHRRRKVCTKKENPKKLPFHHSMSLITLPDGSVGLQMDNRFWRYLPAKNRFQEVHANPCAAVSRFASFSGELWGIGYGASLVRCTAAGKTFFQRGNGYPGKNVRTLRRDSGGTVWSVDYSGVYRLSRGATRFLRFKGAGKKIADVVSEPAQKRVWFLHRDLGVYLRQGTKRRHFFLEDLEYVRAMVRDPRGNIWVGGDNGIVVIQKVGATWKTTPKYLTKRP